MTCEACAETKLEPLLDHFEAGCSSCQARAIAVVGDRQALLVDPLPRAERDVLARVFGSSWEQTLPLVRRWISVIRQAEARA